MNSPRNHTIKTNRREKFWFHQIRAVNYFCYRYWWLVLLGFFIYLFLWYWFCYRIPMYQCTANQEFLKRLNGVNAQMDSCCNCSRDTVVPAPVCPDRVLVFQVCNSNNAKDDNFDVYLNSVKIGNLDLNTDDQVGSIFIASANPNVSIQKADFVCPLSKMKTYYFDPSIVRYGINTIQMKNTKRNNNGNEGTIEVRNYLLQDNGLVAPCIVQNLSFAGHTGKNFTVKFNYTKCCE